jgi:hypothetical protein
VNGPAQDKSVACQSPNRAKAAVERIFTSNSSPGRRRPTERGALVVDNGRANPPPCVVMYAIRRSTTSQQEPMRATST